MIPLVIHMIPSASVRCRFKRVLAATLLVLGCFGLGQMQASDAGSIPLVEPVEAADAGCRVILLGTSQGRTYFKAEASIDWEFSHWSGICYLNRTFGISYIQSSDMAPTAVFKPRAACVCCAQASPSIPADSVTLKIPDGVGSWQAFCMTQEPGCCVSGIPNIQRLGGTSIRYPTMGNACDALVLSFDNPFDAAELLADGIRIRASSDRAAQVEVSLGSIDLAYVDPGTGVQEDSGKPGTARCRITTGPDVITFDLPFAAFGLPENTMHFYPHLSPEVNPQAITEIFLRPHQSQQAVLTIHELGFYRDPAATTSVTPETPSASINAGLGQEPETRTPEIFLKDPGLDILVESFEDWLFLPSWDVHAPSEAHSHGSKSLTNFQFQYGDYGSIYSRPVPDTIRDAQFEDINGNPLVFEDGETAYFSLLNPAFQQHLILQVEAMVDAGAEGIWFDGPEGALRGFEFGGPFDEFSLERLRNDLEDSYSDSELLNLGILDIEAFDYRNFIVENGYRELWLTDPGSVPFFDAYRASMLSTQQEFQHALFSGAKAQAREAGRELAISINADPFSLVVPPLAELLDFFFAEIWYFKGAGDPSNVLWDTSTGFPLWPWFKYAAGQGKYTAVLPPRTDYEYLAGLPIKERTALVLHFLAEAWANRGAYSVGIHPELDTYMFDREELYPYFAFAREHSRLFESVESFADVAIVPAPHPAFSQWHESRAAIGLSLFLGMNNINHDIVPSYALGPQKMALAIGSSWSEAGIQDLLAFARAGGALVIFSEEFASLDETQRPISYVGVERAKTEGEIEYGAGTIKYVGQDPGYHYYRTLDELSMQDIGELVESVTLRSNAPENVRVVAYRGETGLVVHIISYEFEHGRPVELRNVLIEVSAPEGTPDGVFHSLIYSPDGDSTEQALAEILDGRLLFVLPSLQIWSVVEVLLDERD
jgi:hypothetical protein